MKYSEMNAKQQKAFKNVYYAANWLIGSLENVLEDNVEGSEEYESAKAELEDHDGLVKTLYRMAITDVYTEGCCSFGAQAEKYLKDIRFCGKEFIMERCEARIKKIGY